MSESTKEPFWEFDARKYWWIFPIVVVTIFLIINYFFLHLVYDVTGKVYLAWSDSYGFEWASPTKHPHWRYDWNG